MFIQRKKVLIAVVFLAGFLLPSFLPAETKSLKRTVDPVVMECGDLKPLFGSAMDQLALMAWDGNSWAPAPFQLDQRKPDETYAFNSGPAASKDPDPNLDANDELAFMAMDLGDRAENVSRPKGMLSVMEIEVSDPKDGGKGWGYLMKLADNPPRCNRDYVKLERIPAQKRVRYITEEFIAESPDNEIFIDSIAPVKPDGKAGPNILDKIKMDLVVKIPAIRVSFDVRVDRMIKSNNQAWIDGPIRVLSLHQGYAQIAKFIKFRMGGDMIIALYPNSMEFPMRMDQGRVADTSGKELPPEELAKPNPTVINEDIYLDFRSSAYGGRLFNKISPVTAGVVFDGKMSEAEKNLERNVPLSWEGLYFNPGILIARVNVTPLSKDQSLWPRLFYLDDKTKAESPESEPGTCGMGLSLYNAQKAAEENVRNGVKYSVFTTTVYYKKDLMPEQVQQILEIRDNPLKVKARPVAGG